MPPHRNTPMTLSKFAFVCMNPPSTNMNLPDFNFMGKAEMLDCCLGQLPSQSPYNLFLDPQLSFRFIWAFYAP